MARTTKPLTNTEVKNSKPREKEFNLVDGNGLALRVKPNGSKLWVFNYLRPYTKKRTSLSFGSYPAISLAVARTKRNDARELLAKDILIRKDLPPHTETPLKIKPQRHNYEVS